MPRLDGIGSSIGQREQAKDEGGGGAGSPILPIVIVLAHDHSSYVSGDFCIDLQLNCPSVTSWDLAGTTS